ncbi:MAG TPA: hypothetical protein DIT13_19665 [Verrucomicrobiales bacterium]|nr:hypothetical protein [Verrucomicrobiales bacterium]HRJ09298.1 hypothetical protein [Prosthecobacter sp.]HRK15593.1 hypothetical protein [Prosthecobacter sp.]
MNELMGIYEPETDYRAEKLKREIAEAKKKGLILMAGQPAPAEAGAAERAPEALAAQGHLRMSFEEVTPTKAEFWLRQNKGNRRLKRDVVEGYARQMRRGEWMLLPPGIVFDVNGTLLNGQHTLNAVIKAGVTVRMVVTRGVPVALEGKADVRAASVMDSGVPRNAADQMTIQHGVAAGASVIGAMVRSIVNAMLPRRTRRLAVSEIMTVYRMFEAELKWMAENRSKERGLKQAGVMAAFTLAQRWPGESTGALVREMWVILVNDAGYLRARPECAALAHLHEWLTSECGLLMTRRDDRALLPLTLQVLRCCLGGDGVTDASSLERIRETGEALETLLPSAETSEVRKLFGVEGGAA